MAIVMTNNANYRDIAAAIREKAGGTAFYKPAEMAAAIRSIQTGSGGSTTGSVGQKDVNFYDYDGTVVASYTLDEVQNLTELPELPSHSGLVCQGWNWTLEAIKALNRPVDVGAMYITDDGKTRLHVRVWNKDRSLVPLYFSQTVANGVTIEWGDSSAAETLSGSGTVRAQHQYTAEGDYTITLNPAEGCTLSLGSGMPVYCVMGNTGNKGKVYCNLLQGVHIGKNVTSIGADAFYNCHSIASVTIPDGITSIGAEAFYNCYSLASVTIPEGVTSIVESAFASCYSLASITIPDGVTSIGKIAFQNCYGMAEYHLKRTTPPRLAQINAFSNIPSDCIIYVPKGCLAAYQSATNWATYADRMKEDPT